MHPFRFGALVGAASTRAEWIEQIRLAESVGCSSVLCSDHVSSKLGLIASLGSAAELTDLTIGCFVAANDFRNPALFAKETATLDLLCEGRLEVGIGAGWLEEDYRRAGIRLDPPAVRVDRLEESIGILERLWAGEEVDHEGAHYEIHWRGAPVSFRQPRPTLLVGGGGRRMLRLAGRTADIAGISLKLEEGTRDALEREIAAVTEEKLAERVGWIREGAGDRFEQLELNVLVFAVRVTPHRRHTAEGLAGDAEAGIATPHYLVGTVSQICEELSERRARFGISYVVIGQEDLRAAAPVIERLSGT